MNVKTDGRLAGQVALITGGGNGIGRATARRFAAEGAAIVLADVNVDGGRAVERELTDAGVDASFVAANVAVDADVQAMIAHAEERYGKLTILFNNAGIMDTRDDDAVATDEAVWDLTMDVNAKGVFLGCKHGIPALRRAGGGAIVNTASFVALRGAATAQIAYTASKGAVLALTRELAVVHAREGIRVNALCPGPLRTELLMKFLDSDAKRERRLVHVPMGRFGEAEEMAEAALYLAEPASSYVTGTELTVDGGLTAAYVTPEGPAAGGPAADGAQASETGSS